MCTYVEYVEHIPRYLTENCCLHTSTDINNKKCLDLRNVCLKNYWSPELSGLFPLQLHGAMDNKSNICNILANPSSTVHYDKICIFISLV